MPRADGKRCSQRTPSSRISPAVTSSRPAIILRRVDFPHPDGPTNTVNEPDFTTRSIPWMTSTDWKLLRTPMSSSSATPASLDGEAVAGAQDARLRQQDDVALAFCRLTVDARGPVERRKAQ